MRTIILICSLLPLTIFAERYYVATDGLVDAIGNSWAAPTDIFSALERATIGDEIFVKKGIYNLPSNAERTASFVIPNGVHIYGGFEGNEEEAFYRKVASTSVLSGELGEPKSSDNAYTVVMLQSGEGAYTVFDGFTVTAGSGRNFREGLTEGSAGGGLYVAAGAKAATHLIINCIFIDNRAHNGGAVLVDAARPSFIDCTFTNNKADFNGGAVYNNGTGAEASPIFRNCTFTNNSSNSGAGMTNNGTNGLSTPLLIHCDFVDNTSLMNGAAIYNITNDSGEAEPVLEGCSFTGNDSILGDDVSDMGITKPSVVKSALVPRRAVRALKRPASVLTPVRR